MDQKRMIQLIRSNEVSLPRRLSALEELFDVGTPEALLALSHAAFSQAPTLADRARELVRSMGYTQCESLMHLLLQDQLNAYTRKRSFDLLRESKSHELLRYVVGHAHEISEDPAKAKLLSGWLRQTKLMHEWIRQIMVLPFEAALQLAIALKAVDSTLPLAIARIIKSGNNKARIRAMDILGKIADNRDIVPFVISATVSNNAELRSKAILVLGRTSEKLSLIENALTDDDPRVRANAVETLWGMDTDDARMLLRQAARDPNNRVRGNAAKGLCELEHPLGLRTFEEMIEHEAPAMRISGAWGLGAVNALQMIPQLRKLLRDENGNVRRNAALALEKMGVRLLNMRRYFHQVKDDVQIFTDSDISAISRFVPAARALLKTPSQQLHPSIEEVAGADPRVSQRLLTVLKQESPERLDVCFMMMALFAKSDALRAQATQAVSLICQDRTFYDLSLEDESPEVRRAATLGIVQSLIPAASELLSSCLIDPDPYVVIHAAQGLYELKDPRGAEVLAEKLKESNPDIRICAIQAIGRGLISPLTRAISKIAEDDPERRVRSEATNVLERIQRAEEEAVLRNIRVHLQHISTAEHPLLHCYVSVLGEAGQVVRDLKREHFELEETGIEKRDFQIETAPDVVPISVTFVMDYSNGMEVAQIQAMEQGVDRILDSLPDSAKVSIVKYAAEVKCVQSVTMERDLLHEAVHLPYEGDTDGLALYDAIFEGIEPMVHEDSVRVIMAFASGEDDSSSHPSMKLIRYAANHQVAVHLIQYGPVDNREKQGALSKSTHGEFWMLSKGFTMAAAHRRMADILSYHYVLSYHTTPKGSMRGIATLTVGVEYRHFSSRMTIRLPKT